MCTDVNPEAAACTLETARCNKVHIQPIITDLVKGLLPRLKESVDLLVFNPPYVVTPPEEVGSRGIQAAWAGGRNGREVIDRFLPLAPDLLSPRGLFYLVTIKENNPVLLKKRSYFVYCHFSTSPYDLPIPLLAFFIQKEERRAEIRARQLKNESFIVIASITPVSVESRAGYHRTVVIQS
ncbi:methyltransferase N6AMT1 isoform X7 [Bos indicus]